MHVPSDRQGGDLLGNARAVIHSQDLIEIRSPCPRVCFFFSLILDFLRVLQLVPDPIPFAVH